MKLIISSDMDLLKQKIKRRPEDFVVEEVFPFQPLEKGDYSYYLLKKRGRNTLDVLAEISSRWKIPLTHFGFSGLKDKRAVTHQYISIFKGPAKNLRGEDWELEFVGLSNRGISIGNAKGNIFTITIRDVNPYRIAYNLTLIEEIGFANYFGEQRFLSDLKTKRPIALLLLRGNYWEALKEYFTQSNSPYLRQRLKKLWGRWDRFLQEAKHLSHQERTVIKVLKRTGDPEKAFRAFPKNLKLMFLFSYQSMLWNRTLSKLISRTDHIKVPFIKGERLSFHRRITPLITELMELEIPYISSEVLKRDHPYKNLIEEVIEEENIGHLLEKKVISLKAFNPGKRKAMVKPQRLKILYQGKREITVRFFLPAGSYATVMIRKALYL